MGTGGKNFSMTSKLMGGGLIFRFLEFRNLFAAGRSESELDLDLDYR